ncbi:MAG: hypothetical protein DHS20C15_06740 [Planctomycetota bacterium]|nr:MAG: hypothetical protein DHS20C15_06740 [Planctomycetota bacterium]
MPLLLTLALLVFAEIALMVRVAAEIGGLNVFALLVATAVGGVALSRSLRAGLMQRFQRELGEGRVPATELVENFMLLFAGVLLVAPGFLTDALGLALLLPFVRRPLAVKLRARFASGDRGGVFMQMSGRGLDGFSRGGFPPGAGGASPGADPEVSGRTADGTPIRDVEVVQHPKSKGTSPRNEISEGDSEDA